MEILDGDLYFIWNVLQVTIMDIGNWNNNMIDKYIFHRDMG